MLLSFEIENWACFQKKTTLTMQAGPERDVAGNLAKIGSKSRPLKILPCAAIYGGNATGKSQFVRALNFLRNLILERYTKTLPVTPFSLDADSEDSPTSFKIQFVIRQVVYELQVTLSREKGIETEKLVAYTTRNEPSRIVYERSGDKLLDLNIQADSKTKDEMEAFQNVVKKMSLDPSRLFVTLAHILRPDDSEFSAIYSWFADTLHIVTPQSYYTGIDNLTTPGIIQDKTLQYLRDFDSGIQEITSQRFEVSFGGKQSAEHALTPGSVVRISDNGEVVQLNCDKSGKVLATKLQSVHITSAGKKKKFPLAVESDGTNRMINLIPAVCCESTETQPHVFVIDEIDRSLHHLVTRRLIDDFLKSCSADTRKQIIFTTHDLLLMSTKVCRRDEMWVVDKSPNGDSALLDISSFKGVRNTTSIRDYYLDGRFGGIPSGA